MSHHVFFSPNLRGKIIPTFKVLDTRTYYRSHLYLQGYSWRCGKIIVVRCTSHGDGEKLIKVDRQAAEGYFGVECFIRLNPILHSTDDGWLPFDQQQKIPRVTSESPRNEGSRAPYQRESDVHGVGTSGKVLRIHADILSVGYKGFSDRRVFLDNAPSGKLWQ
jgi:hypothetical protein